MFLLFLKSRLIFRIATQMWLYGNNISSFPWIPVTSHSSSSAKHSQSATLTLKSKISFLLASEGRREGYAVHPPSLKATTALAEAW